MEGDNVLYAVALNRFQIDFLLKFIEGVKSTPGIRFAKKPEKKQLLSEVCELERVLRYSLESGAMDD